jgi:hypothetical protein
MPDELIVNVYQVVNDTPGSGFVTSATQQRSLLLEAEDCVTDPRAECTSNGVFPTAMSF